MSNHTGQKNVYCSVCGYGFLNQKHLERHLRVHTKEKPFECDICGSCFSQKFNMYAHKRIIHNGRTENNSKKLLSIEIYLVNVCLIISL